MQHATHVFASCFLRLKRCHRKHSVSFLRSQTQQRRRALRRSLLTAWRARSRGGKAGGRTSPSEFSRYREQTAIRTSSSFARFVHQAGEQDRDRPQQERSTLNRHNSRSIPDRFGEGTAQAQSRSPPSTPVRCCGPSKRGAAGDGTTSGFGLRHSFPPH